MTNPNRPTTPDKQPVYYLAHDNSENPVRKAELNGTDASHHIVSKHTTGERHDSTFTESAHKSDVFTVVDVASAIPDLLPNGNGEDAEVLVTEKIDELIADPEKAKEVYAHLGAEALTSQLTKTPSLEELGWKSRKELIGDETTRGSNDWKIRELIDGIARHDYKKGMTNTLDLGRPSVDMQQLNSDEARTASEKIATENRMALDELYEKYGVDFSQSVVLEHKSPEGTQTRTVYPTSDGLLHFSETTFVKRGDPEPNSMDKQFPIVDVTVGSPEYLEKGYEQRV